MKALLLGTVFGALVALDPVLTTYLFSDFPWLHGFPYALSVAIALTACAAFAALRFLPPLASTVIRDYWRYFPALYLLCFQFNGMAAGQTLDPTELVTAAFIPLFVAALLIQRDQRIVATPFNALHVALAVCLAVSLASEFKPASFIKSFKYFVVFFLLVNCLVRENVTRTFVRWLVILAVPSAVLGLAQEFFWLTTDSVISPIPAKEIEIMFETHFGVPMFRVGAMMVSYQDLALYLATAFFLSLSALLWRQEAMLLRRPWLLVALLVICPALFLTFSKPIYMGCCFGLLLLVLLRWPARALSIATVGGLIGALALVTAIAVVPGKVDTVLDAARDAPKSEVERIRLDRDTIEGFLHGPYFWTGRGINVGYRYTAHSRGWPAHDAFILVAAELGVVGLAIYVAIWGLAIARVVALNVVVNEGPFLFVVRALPGILLLILFQALFQGHYFDSFIWPMFALTEALWFQVRRQAIATTGAVATHATR
jgi:hypothetical protein